MRTLIPAIKRSTLVVAILTALATSAVFVPPAHHASAAGSPSISLQYITGSGWAVVGQGFSPGKTVYLADYTQQWTCFYSCYYQQVQKSYDNVTASQCFVVLYPYAHCGNNTAPGTFTYVIPGNLGSTICSGDTVYAYDYTYGWSNPVTLYNSNACIH
jgi:hypothetical protein